MHMTPNICYKTNSVDLVQPAFWSCTSVVEWCTNTQMLLCSWIISRGPIYTLLVKTWMPFCQNAVSCKITEIHFKDITDIIANCASTHWADRKDGLIGLQCFFRDGRWVFKAVFVTMLILIWFVGCFPVQNYGASQTYLQRCSWTLTPRFIHRYFIGRRRNELFFDFKVFALFLETLCELVSSHKADLYDWLYVLLTRLSISHRHCCIEYVETWI